MSNLTVFIKSKIRTVLNHKNVVDFFILTIVLCIGMWQISFFKGTMKWDIIDINLPWRYFLSECLNNRILPLWNPFINAGFPQSTDPMTWYPVSWLTAFIFGNDLKSLQYEYIFHLLIASWGAYKLGGIFEWRRLTKLFIGISFMFSGMFISNAQHLGWIISASWLPFVFYFYLSFCKKPKLYKGFLAIISLFLILSGGYPAFFIIISYLLLIVFLYYFLHYLKKKKELYKYLLLNIVLGISFLLLSSVVLFSSFELSNYLVRGTNFSLDYVVSYPLPLKGIITFLFPFSITNNTEFWGADLSLLNCYIGIITLIFFIYAVFIQKSKKAIIFFLIGTFFLFTAIADIFPFRKWLYYLPFMDIFRFPTIFRLFGYSFYILSAAIGFNIFQKQNVKDKRLKYCILFILIFTLGISFYNGLFTEKWKYKQFLLGNHHEFGKSLIIKDRIFLQGLITTALLSILLGIFCKIKNKKTLHILLISFFITEMIISTQLSIHQTVIHKGSPKETQNKIARIPKGFHLPNIKNNFENFNDKTAPKIPYLWRNMNIFYKNPSPDGYTPYGLISTDLAQKKGLFDEAIKNPLLFLSDSLINNGIIPKNSIDSLSYKKINIQSFSPNRIELKIQTNKKVLLTYLQNHYPGWEAYINGKKEEIINSNYTFMSLWVKKGENLVKFEFKPKKIIKAFYISLITFISLVLYILFIILKQIKFKE